MQRTAGQRAAVRRGECRLHGHRFTETVEFGRLAPKTVVCLNCGTTWRIHPDDNDDFNFEVPETDA